MAKRIMMALYFILAVFFLSGCATEPALRIGISPDYPPVVFMKDGKPEGIDPSLAHQFEKQTGRKIAFEVVQFDKLIDALQQGKIDIIMAGMSVTPERKLLVNFTTPYLRVGQMLLIREADVKKFQMRSADREKGLRIGVASGTTGEQYAEKSLKWQSVTHFASVNDAVSALEQGAIDCLVHDAPTIWHYSADIATQRKGLVGLYEPLTDESLAWAVRKSDTALLEQLNSELEKMRQNGTLKAVLNRWVSTKILVGKPDSEK